MRPALDPAAPLLRRDAEHLQVGTDPHDAVVLRDLPGVVELLHRCDGVRTSADVLSADTADTAGAGGAGGAAGGADAAAALDALLAAGVLVDVDTRAALGPAAGEPARLMGLGLDAACATATVADRRTRTVRLLGPPVLTEPLGVLLRDCGVPIGPDAAFAADALDLAVVVGHPEPDRALVDSLVRCDVDHLVVRLHPHSALLGPLVRPGRTACLRCADAARADADPAWTGLVAQLDSPLQRPVGARADASPVLVATVVAATATAVLDLLDGMPTTCEGAMLRWSADCGPPRLDPLPPHPRCGCVRLP